MKFNNRKLQQIIKESVLEHLNEGIDVRAKIEALIQQANDAYEQNIDFGKECLMSNQGGVYGLNGPITLDNKGYVDFPFKKLPYTNGTPDPEKIKTFVCKNGKCKYYKDEFHWDYDYRDTIKLLKQVIKDAQRFKQHMEGYDSNWEDDNPQAIKDFNKSIGIQKDYRMNESKLNRIIKESLSKVLNENIGNLSEQEVMMLANIVVKQYGHGNIIDLNDPQSTIEAVQQCMQSTGIQDVYEALKTMVTRGGW